MAKHNVPTLVGEVLKEIGETAATAGWDCHGTFVLLHKALERVAAHTQPAWNMQAARTPTNCLPVGRRADDVVHHRRVGRRR